MDGKWLGRSGVFLIHRDVTHKQNLYWSLVSSESYEALSRDVSALALLIDTHRPLGAVSDWKGAIRMAVASHFGSIPHQRCLVHIEHQVKRLCPKHSPFPATRELRLLATKLLMIRTKGERDIWLSLMCRWQDEYGVMLTEKTKTIISGKRRWWYTHGNLRRGWRILTFDQKPFFLFLDYPIIPSTNNALEGVNSQIKNKLGDHRGLTRTRQAAFLSWYMAFTRTKTPQELKRLWDTWRKAFL